MKVSAQNLKEEHGYLFSVNELAKKGVWVPIFWRRRNGYRGRASVACEGEREGPEALTDTSPSQVAGHDGRSPGASVMGEQKLQPSSPQKIGTHAPKEQTTLNLHPVKFPKGNYFTGQAIF